MSENGPQSDNNTVLRQIRELLRGAFGGGNSSLTDAQLRASPVPVSMSFDVEIGAVELKNASSDQRATITSRGALQVEGAQADDAVAAGNPALVGGVTVDPTSLPANTVAGRLKGLLTNLQGILLSIIPNLDGSYDTTRTAIPADMWSYPAATGGILNTTTAVTVKTAAGLGIRNYVKSLQLMSEALGTATEFAIRDGAGGTVLWRTKIGTGGLTGGEPIVFDPALKGSANTLLEVVTLTASGTGAVYPNLQGYTGI
jgi:hypothetical protein